MRVSGQYAIEQRPAAARPAGTVSQLACAKPILTAPQQNHLALVFAACLGLVALQQRASAQDATPLPEIVVDSPKPRAATHRKRKASNGGKRTAKAAPAKPPKPAPVPATQPAPADVPSPPDDTATAVSAQAIQAQQGATIAGALQDKPGVAGSTFAPGANRPILRGLDNYRVRVQENGIGTHDVSALSEDHAVPVDPYAAERVEIVRGPAALRYGSQAAGGIVSIDSSRIPTAIPSNGFAAEILGGLNSGDDGRDGAFKVTAGAGAFAVHADGFKRSSDDYATPLGRQSNSFVDSDGGAFGASAIGPDGYVGVAVAHLDSLYGIPGADTTDRSRIDLTQDKAMASGKVRIAGFGIDTLSFQAAASDYAHNELATEDGADVIGSRFTNREQEGRLELQHTPAATPLGHLTGSWGAQWGHRQLRGQSFEGDSLLEPAETDSAAAFAFEELRLDRHLSLQGAARIERNTVSGIGLQDPFADDPVLTGAERTFTPVSFATGALYRFPRGIVARLSGLYTERAPDAGELFSKGVHEATGTFEIGDPNLDVEAAKSLEFGLQRSLGDLRFDASIYRTRYDGFIFKQLTGVRCGDVLASCGIEDELKQVVFSQRDATFHGAELTAELDVARVWRGVWGLDGRYDFVRAEFSDGENVPRIPPHRLGGGLFYRDGNWFARLGVLHAFDQDEIGLNETETAGYTLLSAEVRYTTRLAANAFAVPELTIGLKGENLADDEVRNHVSFKKDEVLEPGASVRLFGSVKLN